MEAGKSFNTVMMYFKNNKLTYFAEYTSSTNDGVIVEVLGKSLELYFETEIQVSKEVLEKLTKFNVKNLEMYSEEKLEKHRILITSHSEVKLTIIICIATYITSFKIFSAGKDDTTIIS
ncbi:hypothetical protein RCL_jg5454.t1 [Rhizophagus clarus]|uniref:Uncharacterized protein n=1 Tax=Rhizophagus clarus TaxID=94130 RepID=A0A8H3M6Q9_9GLOM|nr:hypothetical protein RCL_jg5454.t1 [Rhizophagus clarus]